MTGGGWPLPGCVSGSWLLQEPYGYGGCHRPRVPVLPITPGRWGGTWENRHGMGSHTFSVLDVLISVLIRLDGVAEGHSIPQPISEVRVLASQF